MGQYSATINWGDSTPATSGVVTYEGGTAFAVSGSHTYGVAGSYMVTINVTGPNGEIFLGSGQAVVSAPIIASAAPIAPVANVSFTGVVATFIDENPSGGASSDYQATIAWGDGHVSMGTIGGPTNGYLTVTGTNTYSTPGSYSLTVTIVSTLGGTTTTQPSSVVVGAVPVPLSGYLSPASISGPNSALNITNVNRPTFQGIASPYAIVQLFAQHANADPTTTISIGQTIAGADGSWSLTSTTLADGAYTISASSD